MKLMFVYMFVFLFILFSFGVLAQEVDLNNYDSLRVKSDVVIPISFEKTSGGADFDYLDIDYFWLPQEDYRQKIVSLSSNPLGDVWDNNISLRVDSPEDFVFEVSFVTDTVSDSVKVNSKVPFPLEDLDSSLIEYTKETELIDITPDIKALASKLAKDEDDLFVVVFKLADWVNTNVDYNLSTVTKDASLPSSWVLENRRGVCDEMSNLFISMVRSLGIPARSVSGVAYTDSELFAEPWGPHGWAEVYFPDYGWVPFDPTYNQLGFVDASHIKLGEGLDSDRFNVKYSWRSRGYDVLPGKQDVSSTVLKKGDLIKDNVDVSVSFLENDVSFDSYNVVKAKVTNLNNYYIALGVSLGSVNGLNNIDERTKDVLLMPGESREVSWVVKLDGDFSRNFVYTFPIVVYTFSGFNVSDSFTASDTGSFISRQVAEDFSVDDADDLDSNILFSCSLDDKVVYVGKKVGIGCEVDYEKGSNLRVCLDGDCKVVVKEDYNNIRFEKVFDEPGFFTFSVIAKKLSFSEQSFLTVNVLDETGLFFSDVNLPSDVKFDDFVVFNFTLEKSSKSVPKNISVSILHDNFEELWLIDELLGKQRFVFNFPAQNLKPGDNSLVVFVEYFDEADKKYSFKKSFDIGLVDLSFDQRILLWFKSLVFWFESLF